MVRMTYHRGGVGGGVSGSHDFGIPNVSTSTIRVCV